jgi:hypothetical protein
VTPRPAPAFDCALCGRRIGKAATHWQFAARGVLCSRCVDREDLYDEEHRMGTRAGIAHVLGLWP